VGFSGGRKTRFWLPSSADGNLVTIVGDGRCRPLLAGVHKSTDAEQKGRKRISFLADIEEPDSDQNAYHDHGDDFEHGVRSGRFSGSHAERLAEGLSSQMRRRPIGP